MKHTRSIFIFSALIIAMFCILGSFSRQTLGDDHAFYNLVAENGLFNSVAENYIRTNGRITNHFFMGIFSLFPVEKVYPVLASVNSLAYVLSCFSLVCAVVPALALSAKLSLSLLACALTLCFTYSLSETFYWLAGSPYFLSGTLILLALSFALRAFRGSRLSFVLCMSVLFFNSMLLEQPCVFQGIISFLAMLFFIVRGEKKRALISGAFWLVSVAGFCVLYFAPGTAQRMSNINTQSQFAFMMILRGLVPAFSMGVLHALQFLAKPVIYSVIFFMPSIAERVPPADERLSRAVRVWHIVAAVFAVGVFMQFMMGVISGGGLPLRAVSLSMWLMYFVWNVLWIFFYRGDMICSVRFRTLCDKLKWPVLILSVVISANFRECVNALRVAPDYAAERDARAEMAEEQIRDGMKVLRLPLLRNKPALIFVDFDPRRDNREVAKYYGVEKIYGIPRELYGNLQAEEKLISGDIEPLAGLAEEGNADMIRVMGYYRDPRRNYDNPEVCNADEAEKWYLTGAEMGDPMCMRPLARLLLPKNFSRAVFWLVKAHIALFRL